MTLFVIIYLGIVISTESPPSRPALTREIKLWKIWIYDDPQKEYFIDLADDITRS